MELVTGAIAAGGGCVARAEDGRVVFVRHALPGERVVARVTAESTVVPAGRRRRGPRAVTRPGGASLPPCRPRPVRGLRLAACRPSGAAPASSRPWWRSSCAGWPASTGDVGVEEVAGAPDGLGWRTRSASPSTATGRGRPPPSPLPRHRAGRVLPHRHDRGQPVGAGSLLLEGGTPRRGRPPRPTAGRPVVAGRHRARAVWRPARPSGPAWWSTAGPARGPATVALRGARHRFEVGAGVFWQVHPSAAAVLTRCVLEGLAPRPGSGRPTSTPGPACSPSPLARAVGAGGLGGGRGAQRAGPCRRRARNTAGLAR